MSVDEVILKELLRPVARRGGISFNLLVLPVLFLYKKKTIQNGLARLKRKEYVAVEGRHLVISPKGKRYLKRRRAFLQIFDSPFPKNADKNLIVMFDIPEPRKAEREWFRAHLHKFGYEMIQKSVWIGPSPLPKSFISYIYSINLGDAIKTFRATPVDIGFED